MSDVPAPQVGLSEAEKSHIVAQVEFERRVREVIAKPDEKKKSWGNSALGLLIVGSLLSGLLVPSFQYTEKAFDTRRSSHYETLTFRLTVLRQTLADLALGSSFNDQTWVQLQRPRYAGPSDRPKAYTTFLDAVADVQAKRFEHNAKLLSASIYFNDRARFDKELQAYFNLSTQFAADIVVAGKLYCAGETDVARAEAKVSDDIGAMNIHYDELERLTKSEIGKVEDERNSFW